MKEDKVGEKKNKWEEFNFAFNQSAMKSKDKQYSIQGKSIIETTTNTKTNEKIYKESRTVFNLWAV